MSQSLKGVNGYRGAGHTSRKWARVGRVRGGSGGW